MGSLTSEMEGGDSVELFVSGRLCLFGEHTDWAGEHKGRSDSIMEGRTIVVGTQEGLFATAWPLKEKVKLRSDLH